MWDYILTFAGGAATGVIIYKIIIGVNNNKNKDKSKILEECFGKPMWATNFTIDEAKEWITVRKQHLENGAKAVIMKINDNTLKSLGKELNIGFELENMMIVAIVNTQSSYIIDSVLIKYETLDQNLEKTLAKGNGVLVVER